jgi:hypothetical protein
MDFLTSLLPSFVSFLFFLSLLVTLPLTKVASTLPPLQICRVAQPPPLRCSQPTLLPKLAIFLCQSCPSTCPSIGFYGLPTSCCRPQHFDLPLGVSQCSPTAIPPPMLLVYGFFSSCFSIFFFLCISVYVVVCLWVYVFLYLHGLM